MTTLRFFVVTFVLVTLSTAAHAAQPTLETFDAGANGWTGNTTSSVVVHVAAGGNPDGHLQSRRAGSFDIGALIDSDDSADFTGDYAAAGITGASFDLNPIEGPSEEAWLRFRSGPTVNGWRFPVDIASVPQGTWQSYSVAFDPAWDDATAMGNGWIKGADPVPSFAATLASVDTMEIRVSDDGMTIDGHIVGIDNVSIVPEPSSAMLVGWLALLILPCVRK